MEVVEDEDDDKAVKTLKSGAVLRVHKKVPSDYASADGVTGYEIRKERKNESVSEELGLPFRDVLFFEKCGSGKNSHSVRCRACLAKVSWHGNPAAALKHFKIHHKNDIAEMPVMGSAEKESHDILEQARRSARGQALTDLRQTLASIIACYAGENGLALTSFSSESFATLLSFTSAAPEALVPKALPGRDLIKKNLVRNGEKVVDVIKARLARAEFIAVQFDGWGDKGSTMHVLGVCAQIFVDGGLQSLNVDIEPLSSPATAEEYERALRHVLGRFSVAVPEKSSALPLVLTADGAATNASMFSSMASSTGAVGLVCAAHTLHNAVCAAVASSDVIKSLIQDAIHVNLKFKNCRALKMACADAKGKEVDAWQHKRFKRTVAPKTVIETRWASLPSAIRNYLENVKLRREVLVRFDGSRVHDTPVSQPPKWQRAKSALFDQSLESFLRDLITIMEPFEFFSLTLQSSTASIGTLYLDLGKLVAGLYARKDEVTSAPAKAFSVLLRQQIEARFFSCVPKGHRTSRAGGVRPDTDGQPSYGWCLSANIVQDVAAEGEMDEEDSSEALLDEIFIQADDDSIQTEQCSMRVDEILSRAKPGAVHQRNVPPGIYSLEEQRALGMSPLDAKRAAVYAVAAFMHPEVLGRHHYLPDSLVHLYAGNLALQQFVPRTASYILDLMPALMTASEKPASTGAFSFCAGSDPAKSEASLFDTFLPLTPPDNRSHVDACAFWSTNRSLPTMRKIALAHLSIPPSSAGPERLFSRLGFIWSERRRRMNMETLRSYVHSQDLSRTIPNYHSS